MPEFSKYDSDPEALEWARGKVQHVIDKMERFERQAAERGDSDPRQWRKIANILRMELVGGKGCVIAPFDWRLPDFVAALTDASAAPTPAEERNA